MEDELNKNLIALNMDMEIENELKKPTKNVEQLTLTSISCYELALECADGNGSRNDLLSRIGSVLNDLGWYLFD